MDKRTNTVSNAIFIGSIAVIMIGTYIVCFSLTRSFMSSVILFLSILMTLQGFFTLYIMIYGWNNPEKIKDHKSPKKFLHPVFSFTALIPARQEEDVIQDTIKAVSEINYPEHLKEVFIICEESDKGTIEKSRQMIDRLNKSNISLCLYNSEPINKSHSLNEGLKCANGDIVVVFDAEDEPHKDIYQIANTLFIQKKCDVLQAGVQLMNFRSSWFSTFNVLEYFFWFKSALHFFAKQRIIPLGGNTVFFKKHWLEKVNGWDVDSLTEDADIGIRLSQRGARIAVVYDEEHTTKEETPPDIGSFIRQRTRWNQGFLQLFLRNSWLHFEEPLQKILALYVFAWPIMQSLFFFYLFLSIIFAFFIKLPVFVVIISLFPFAILLVQQIISIIGLYEFTRDYKLDFPWWISFKVLATFYLFYLILGISAIRSILRLLHGSTSWEKTAHINAHRIKPRVRSFNSAYYAQKNI